MTHAPAVGEPIRRVALKWPDQPHWEHDAVLLGEDEHGVWVGAPAGTLMTRPGVEFLSGQAQVTLLPRDRAFVATFYAPGGSSVCDVYVDIATVPVWSGATVTAVDLDLDVVRGWTGRVWVDDEDEFAANRHRLGYSPDLVEVAPTSCEQVRLALTGARPPYDGAAPARWLDALAALAPRQRSAAGGAPPHGTGPERTDQAGSGEPVLEPAGLTLQRLGDVLPEDDAGGQGDRDRGGVDHRHQTVAALGEQEEAAVDREPRQQRHDR
jgi:uncharacterized protein